MAAKPLKGYKRVAGTRRYLTPRGVEITEYEYRSRLARRAGHANYSSQLRFRRSQDFLQLRFNILSIDPGALIGTGSELEAAAVEAMADPHFGQIGYFATGNAAESAELAQGEIRLAALLAAMGAPDYYFWRFWYSDTRSG